MRRLCSIPLGVFLACAPACRPARSLWHGRSGALGRLLIVLTIMALASGPAAAAAPGAALKKFEEGSRLFAANNPTEALRAFQASLELEPSPNTLFKIAKCYLALERTASAYINFRRAAKEAQDRIKATGEQRFVPTQAAAEAEVAQLDSRVPRITLELPPDTPGQVAISVDGEVLPPAIWSNPIEIDPGPHRISAVGPLISPYESSFEVKPSETRNIPLPLVRRPTGTILFSFNKQPVGLSAVIDGQQVPPEQVPIPIVLGVGLHKIVVSAPGFLDAPFERTLHDKESLTLRVELFPAPRRGISKTAFLTVFGCAVGLAIVGAGFGAKAQLTANEQVALPVLLREPGLHDEVRTNAIIANLSFAVSGTLGLASIGLAAATRWREPSPPKKFAFRGRGAALDPFDFASLQSNQAAASAEAGPLTWGLR